MVDTSRPPYNDRFDPSRNWTKLLFNPQNALFQSELNELQSAILYQLQQNAETSRSDGSIISGMNYAFNGNELTVEDGKVYVNGQYRNFDEQTITLTREGTERVGVRVKQEVITSEDDSVLLDNTQGVPSSGKVGADRLKETVELTLDDEEAPTIYRFEDGDLFEVTQKPESEKLNDLLALRTYEESGSYRVEGFQVYSDREAATSSTVRAVIDSGIAYVLGYRKEKPSSTRLDIPRSMDTKNVVGETHTFDANDQRVLIGSSSVANVNLVMGESETPSGGIEVNKGSTDTRDSLPSQYTSITRNSVEVWEEDGSGNVTETYEINVDYRIVEENGISYIDWNTTDLNATEPTTGNTYRASFEYNRQMSEGDDYTVEVEDYDDETGSDTYLVFEGTGGAKPLDGGLVEIDYSFYLARKDLIVLNSDGEFVRIEGQPARLNQVSAPNHEDPLTLQIGTFLVYPNSRIAKGKQKSITRLTMEQLQKMKTRIEDLETNQAILNLENEAIVSENQLELRGVFADGFINMDRVDRGISNVAFSFEDAHITLQKDVPDSHKRTPEYLENNSDAYTWGRLVSAPFDEVREIWQPFATESKNVNPYQIPIQMGVMKLDPSSDNWIEEETVTVTEDAEPSELIEIERWWTHPDQDADSFNADSQWAMENLNEDDLVGIRHRREETRDVATGELRSAGQRTKEESIEFIRQRDIDIKITGVRPNEDNMVVYFDSLTVPITPASGFQSGSSEEGSIRANSEGVVEGTITVPSGVRTGTREVRIEGGDSIATASYTAQGKRKTTENVVLRERVSVQAIDPLAQSFQLNSNRVITSVGLYFATKSETDRITIQIRNLTESGFPGSTVHAETILEADDVTVSNDASEETRVYFDDPIMAKSDRQYCVTVITGGTDYEMWIATRNSFRIDSPEERVNGNPYPDGVLFSSSNNVTWSDHQDQDMKFALYTANFNESGTVEFDEMEDVDGDQLLLMASALTPDSTGCSWEIKVIPENQVGSVAMSNVDWEPIFNYLERDSGNDVAGSIKLRATFRANRYISPLLALDDIMFNNFVTQTSGDYVTRTMNFSQAPFNEIKLSYDVFTPTGSDVTPYYSTDGGETWNEFESTPDEDRQSREFTRFTFREEVQSSATLESCKIKLELSSDSRLIRPRVRRLTVLCKDAI